MEKLIEKIKGLFSNFSSPTSTQSYNSSLGAFVAISVTSKGMMQMGYGAVMTLINVDTNETFTSKSLGRISPHSILENIPEGKYRVYRLEIPLGDLIYINESQDLLEYFGLLEFKKGSAYYLGDFIGKRKIGKENVFHLNLQSQNIPEKLIKKLNGAGISLSEIEMIKTFPDEKTQLLLY